MLQVTLLVLALLPSVARAEARIEEPKKHQLAATPTGIGAEAPDKQQDPKGFYAAAYRHLLQGNNRAAEAAFAEFLRRHPNDRLAGDAQYWLGQALYGQRRYLDAANEFRKGYQNYAQSAAARDSLLGLATSLLRLGKKKAACSSFAEFTTRFPNAPQHIKTRAEEERQLAGCAARRRTR
jgi:tol-pal system protein YbgF